MSLTLNKYNLTEKGCPSGGQTIPIDKTDPLGHELNLAPYVQSLGEGQYSVDLIVQGAHCGGCLAKIERGLKALPKVNHARMNLSTLRLNVIWQGERGGVTDIVRTLVGLGYGAAPYEVTSAVRQSEQETRNILRAMAAAGFAAVNVMLLSIAVWSGAADMGQQTHNLLHWISAAIALPTVAYAGQTFFRSAWNALRHGRTNMDVPISLALFLACSLSMYETVKGNPDTYFDAAVMLLFLLLIGRYLDAKLRLRTGEAARRLAALQVTSATRIISKGGIETVPARDIIPGDRLLIPAGQRIPVDCKIMTGRSEVDMRIATGETKHQIFGVGDTLYSGTTNQTAPLTVRAISKYSDSFLSEITSLVEAGEQKKSRFVKIADRAAKTYVPVVHSVAAITFIGWMMFGADIRTASLNAIAVLIITCPCALGLAVPAVQIVAAGRLFKKGVLIKSGDALERLAKTKSVIFDKTGTLTTGEFELLNTLSVTPRDLSIATALAKHSFHPLSRALHKYDSNIALIDIKELPGKGVSGKLNGIEVLFGSANFVGESKKIIENQNSVVWLKVGEKAAQPFILADCLRPDAIPTITTLQTKGILIELLSGDDEDVTRSVADRLNIAISRGGVSPREKMDVIHKHNEAGHFPLMVGDGINDAPALAAANSSASLANAADISRSAADIILQGDKLGALPYAIDTARQAQRRVVENLCFAVAYNIVAIPLAIFGFVNPLIAALAMSGSSLIVTLNALRLQGGLGAEGGDA